MIIYVVLTLLIFIYGLIPYMKQNSRQSNRIFLFLSFASMTIVVGLRGITVGEDTGHYLDIFKYADFVKWSDMLHSTGMRTAYYTNEFGYTDTIENGFLALCKIVHLFTDNGQVFLFVVAAITFGLFAKFIYDNCLKTFYPTYIFLCESLFMMSFNGIRQLLAGAIAIQAYTLLKENKVKKAIVVVLLAAVIHNVALVFLIIFPIMLRKQKKKSNRDYHNFKYVLVAVVASPFLIMAMSGIIVRVFPRYGSYFSVNYWENKVGGAAVLWIIELVIVVYMYYKKFKIEGSYYASVFTLAYLSCELMGLQVTMFSRVGLFFRPFLMLLFPIIEKYFGRNNRLIIRIVLMTLLAMLFFSYASTPVRQYAFFLVK